MHASVDFSFCFLLFVGRRHSHCQRVSLGQRRAHPAARGHVAPHVAHGDARQFQRQPQRWQSLAPAAVQLERVAAARPPSARRTLLSTQLPRTESQPCGATNIACAAGSARAGVLIVANPCTPRSPRHLQQPLQPATPLSSFCLALSVGCVFCLFFPPCFSFELACIVIMSRAFIFQHVLLMIMRHLALLLLLLQLQRLTFARARARSGALQSFMVAAIARRIQKNNQQSGF